MAPVLIITGLHSSTYTEDEYKAGSWVLLEELNLQLNQSTGESVCILEFREASEPS